MELLNALIVFSIIIIRPGNAEESNIHGTKNNNSNDNFQNGQETRPINDSDVTIHPSTKSPPFFSTTTHPPDCYANNCYKKCCPVGNMFTFESFSCIPYPLKFANWTPEVRNYDGHVVKDDKKLIPIQGMPVSDPTKTTLGPSLHPGFIIPGGKYYVEKEDNLYDMNSYCVDLFHVPFDNPANFKLPNDEEIGEYSIVSFEFEIETTYDIVKKYLHPVTLSISCFSLLIIVGSFIFIEKIRIIQGTQGKILISHASSFLVGNIILLITAIPVEGLINNKACIAIAIISHYSFMAAFLWLNVMCFDIWVIVRASLAGLRVHRGHVSSKRFLWYSLYAWGTSIIIVVISITMNFLPRPVTRSWGIPVPQYGEGSCWMPRDMTILFTYFYGFVGFILLVNIILLFTTANSLMHFQQRIWTKIRIILNIKEKDDSNDENKIDCENYLKKSKNFSVFNGNHKKVFIRRFLIFALIASCWLFELISTLIGPRELWSITDLLNTLQGFFLLVIYLKPKNKRDAILEFFNIQYNTAKSKLSISLSAESTLISTLKRAITKNLSKTEENENPAFDKKSQKFTEKQLNVPISPVKLISINLHEFDQI